MPADSRSSETPTDAPLPTTVAELQALLRAERQQASESFEQRVQAEVNHRIKTEVQQRVATELAKQVKEILERWRVMQHRVFGASSEAQFDLFNEVEAEAADATDEQAEDTTESTDKPSAPQKPKRRGKRTPLPPELPRVEHVIDVPEAERQCGCGIPMTRIGEDVSERLDIVPMKIRVIRTIRPRYGCPKGKHAPKTVPAVPSVLPRSQFSAGLLASVLVGKYVDGLPLNRFAQVLKRHGVDVPRQSLARAVIATSKALQPLRNLAQDSLLDAPVIHMDETPVQVLKEPARAATSKSYMWVRRGGPPDRTVVLFDYDASRSQQVPVHLLEGWQGYLMTDDYGGYNAVARRDGVEHLACMAHARRKFVEAKRAQPNNKTGRANRALQYFARLYAIEKQCKDGTADARYHARQQHSVPILEEFKNWLDETLPTITPKSKLGQALKYLDSVWPKLIRYTERGDLPIDNNPCENAIRPFVVGRKGWLFADTPAGAHASAVIYSLVETAKANGQEPYAWLRFVLERLPFAETVSDVEALLPWNTHEQDLAMNLAACE